MLDQTHMFRHVPICPTLWMPSTDGKNFYFHRQLPLQLAEVTYKLLKEGTGSEYCPLISVIIPVYNVANYLNRCIVSIVENDYKNLQIIFINDGSTDESGSILESWRKRESRIQVITTTNHGLPEARNTGIREAMGDYIAFIDSDDWVHRQYFSILLQGSILYSADISMCGEIRVGDEDCKYSKNVVNPNWIKMDISQFSKAHNRGYAWGKLYKREFGQSLFDSTVRICEDTIYNMSLVFHHPEMIIATTKAPLYFYYRRPGSIMDRSTGDECGLLFYYFIPYAYECIDNKKIVLQRIFVKDTIKRALAYRYLTMYNSSLKESVKKVIGEGKELLRKERGLVISDKIVYMIFLYLPFTYRAFRIVNDPTMISWERKKKKEKYIND